jgi:hypothetical protein
MRSVDECAAFTVSDPSSLGGNFISDVGNLETLPAMRIIPGIKCELIPIRHVNKTDLDTVHEGRFVGGQMFDVFIPEDAPNCPVPSVRNRPNGHITGDLFEEVKPGYYAFRGRNDDWIRTGKHLSFCDTKYVADFPRECKRYL